MPRFLFAILIFGVASGYPAMRGKNVSRDSGYSYQIAPHQQTPVNLKEAWLKFHEDGLCQLVDAEFQFPDEKMVVWAKVEKEKNYRKLSAMLKPWVESRQVELHAVRPGIQKGEADIRTPPPSFWTNSELIERFHDSYLWNAGIMNQDSLYNTMRPAGSILYAQPIPLPIWGPLQETPTSTVLFGQRLLMFAQDTLQYDREMSRYAAELPPLARVAFDTAETPALGLRALAVYREHIRKLQKYEKKLKNNLSIALPGAVRTPRKAIPIEKTAMPQTTAFDLAVRLAGEIQDLSDGVYQFMYPENHTVSLADLRDPSLVQSLEMIQSDTAELLTFTR